MTGYHTLTWAAKVPLDQIPISISIYLLKIVSHFVTVNKQNGIPDVLNSIFNISLRLVQISRKGATGK